MVLGGSLEHALAGEYKIDLRALLKEGWALSNTNRWVMVQAVLLLVSLTIVGVLAYLKLAEIKGIEPTDPQFLMLAELGWIILSAPLFTGLIMMGINNSVGGICKPEQLFHFLPRTLVLALTALMSGLLVELGMMLFILPGLYLMVATSFSLPLVVEKGLTPAKAIFVSIRVINHKWREFLLLYCLFGCLFFLSIITFGLALFWVAPFYYAVKGLLYRDIFGITVRVDISTGVQHDESVFHA
ncbi:hypothetical protein GCM10027098_11340 [Bowmanella dokdonensis]